MDPNDPVTRRAVQHPQPMMQRAADSHGADAALAMFRVGARSRAKAVCGNAPSRARSYWAMPRQAAVRRVRGHGRDARARITESAASAERANARPMFQGGIADAAISMTIVRLAASGEADRLRHPGFVPTSGEIGRNAE
ncbi:hypothetical protein ACF3M1_13070 [Luteimonas sp. WGS1318]|uniref:hypothetical protein n=1 Tax=Luteimonas sp. WGS1318 TaxID=3366815 RepID=UPI00372D67C4